MQLHQKLKDSRLKAGLTQEALAQELGVSRQTISNWESGRTYPDISSVLKLSDLYGLSLDELLKEDAGMRHHMEQARHRLQLVCEWVHDFGVILIPVAWMLVHYGFDNAAIAVTLLGIVLISVPQFLFVWKFGADAKLVLIRTLGYAMWVAAVLIRRMELTSFARYNLLWFAGMGLRMYADTKMTKAYRRKSSAFLGFALALVLVFSFTPNVTDAIRDGSFNSANPFGSRYRVAEVLYPTETTDGELPIVKLNDFRMEMELDYQGAEDVQPGGSFAHVVLPENSPLLGVWELVPEEDPHTLYRITVEADGSILLSCLNAEQLQWKYRLTEAEVMVCNVTDVLGIKTFRPEWRYADTYVPELSQSSGVRIDGDGTMILALPTQEETLTIEEAFYHNGSLESRQTHTLHRNEKGSFTLPVGPRHEDRNQHGVYIIPYAGGEFVIELTFWP